VKRGLRISAGAAILALAATAWTVRSDNDPSYDDDTEVANYLAAVRDHRTPRGRLPLPEPSVLLASVVDLELPTSARAEAAKGTFAATVVISKHQLTIGGDPLPVVVFPEGLQALATTGFPGRYKSNREHDLFVPDLANGLSWWGSAAKARALGAGEEDASGRLAVLADASTPHRVLVEVVFTAG
jgi:hypothetical protein